MPPWTIIGCWTIWPLLSVRWVMNILGQYLKCRAECGGLIWGYRCGIPLGCPLSPLLGACFLTRLDVRMARLGLAYVRFMDDILVFAPTRWRVRHAVTVVNQELGALGLDKHPDKTFIGRIQRGFDFLGYHFSLMGFTVARTTFERFVTRVTRLYERERERPDGPSALGDYVRRWGRWARGGFASVHWLYVVPLGARPAPYPRTEAVAVEREIPRSE